MGTFTPPLWRLGAIALDPLCGSAIYWRALRWTAEEDEMLDAVMLVAGLAFFAVAIAYVAACDRM